MKNTDYLEAFQDYLTEEERSQGTIYGYTCDVRDFISFLGKDVKKIKRTDINNYKKHLKDKKLKAQSLNRKLVSIKQFIDFLNDRFETAISARIKQEKIQKQYSLKDEELLSEGDYNRLIKAVDAAGDLRAKALFEAMYYSGMRISEVLQLRVDHVENGARVIEDIKGKGGKYRDIYIKTELISTLRDYLKVRKQPFSSTTKALFTSERGALSRQTAHTLMKKYAKAAGVEESKAHVHNLRHLFGLRLAEKGVPIQDIAKYMGHTSIEVTKIYLEKPQSYYSSLIDNL
ncbi:tyrosine-type recombinase/integrase [Cytobacillus oceanisediminis]|uniref:tyrosine-type recombinase/integrase n=1 Tax=Cytobacillus oceanisediminis TaxID=665099 RepID=UPI00203CA45C|nr:tyrosine-type recombinase/integrase [Cytobacillus oceanisediminis]MCM3405938.1 tyrosine-type recombinase/integrase [Cytobacillus oceanisediminis]